MTETTTDANGMTQAPNGAAEKTQSQQNASMETTETVANPEGVLKKNKELLGKLKAAQEKLAEIERKNQETEEARLKEQGEFKKLAEARQKKLEENEARLKQIETNLQNGKKLSAFLKAAPVKDKFWDIIDLDKIAVDPETGEPDATSVQQYADIFKQTYSEVLDVQKKPGMPNQSTPTDVNPGISLEDYKNLSPQEMKEKAAIIYQQRLKELSNG